MTCLYPRDSWNCVLADGMGMVSSVRYDIDFYLSYCECRLKKVEKMSSSGISIFNNLHSWNIGCFATLIYEIRHKFELWHYHWLANLIQGSTHLEEVDLGLSDFLPIYLDKLQCAAHVSLKEQFREQGSYIDDEPTNTTRVTLRYKLEKTFGSPWEVEWMENEMVFCSPQ